MPQFHRPPVSERTPAHGRGVSHAPLHPPSQLWKHDVLKPRVARLRRRPTRAERMCMELLSQLGVDYRFQYPVRTRRSFIVVDFFVPAVGLCIEIDGPYHHAQRQATRDLASMRYLYVRRGFRVVRYRNEQLLRQRQRVLDDLRRRVGKRRIHATR